MTSAIDGREPPPDPPRDRVVRFAPRRPGRLAGRKQARSGNLVPEASVAAMFDGIAPVYDRMNTIMTLGLDAGWRRAAVNATATAAGDRVVDVACGTGKLAAALADRVGPFGRVVGVDLSAGMVAQGSRAYRDVVQLEFAVANALQLPFDSGSFDAATIAFGLRNLSDFEAGFREMARVVRPGGRVVCLELTLPRPRALGRAYHAVFRRMAPFIGGFFGRREAYQYLPDSLDGFPDPDRLVTTMRDAGLANAGFQRLGLGTVALHVGTVPEA